ncbi:unnamed protein product [Trichobilharzia szidati]|nr:unnamed protein product [Trichobilharzia szidati]
MDKTQLNNDFDFTSKTLTTGVVDEYGNTLISTVKVHQKRHSGKYCRHLLKVIFKHLGLTLLLIGYLCAGGYIFRSLELANDAQDCYQRQRSYAQKLNSTTLIVIGTLKSINTETTSSQTAEEIIRNILNRYAEDLYALDFKPSTDCDAILNTADGSKWSFVNSVFFCVTVITTIGYGHIAPATFWGRITCIIYAIVGIPLMLIYLAIIGNLFARMFRVVFLNLVCCRCFYDTIKRKREERRKRLRQWEEDLRQHEEEEARRRGLPLPPRKIQSVDQDDDLEADDDFDELDSDSDGSKMHVPLTVSVIVLSAYTMIGAAIFPRWEDWSMANAAYFSFITISTIGFGDLVPGNGRFSEPKTAVELLVGGLYLLFGLSLLSMCLNLMKDEIIAKVHYICACIGVRRNKSKTGEDQRGDDDDRREEPQQELEIEQEQEYKARNAPPKVVNENYSNKETTKLVKKQKKTKKSKDLPNEYDNQSFEKDT